MNRKLKIIAAVLIGIMPTGWLRKQLYRLVLGYKIDAGSSIGWGNLLLADKLYLTGSRIGYLNRVQAGEFILNKAVLRKLNSIIHLNRFQMEEGSDVDSRNNFYGTLPESASPFKEFENMYIGPGTTVTSMHKFDLSDEIRLSSQVVIGGYNSQFWTHGFDTNKIKKIAAIHIHDHVYVASSCIILPGTTIASRVSISAGTVVPKSLLKPGLYFSSKLEYRENQLIEVGHASDTGGPRVVRKTITNQAPNE